MEKINGKEIISQLNILRISSVLIVLFLFFIDEGYYSFNWVSDIRIWFLFGIYLAIIFTGTYLTYKLIQQFQKKKPES